MPGPRRNLDRHFTLEIERLDREIAQLQTQRDRIVRAQREYHAAVGMLAAPALAPEEAPAPKTTRKRTTGTAKAATSAAGRR